MARRARALETCHALDPQDPLASPANIDGIRPLEGGESPVNKIECVCVSCQH